MFIGFNATNSSRLATLEWVRVELNYGNWKEKDPRIITAASPRGVLYNQLLEMV